jgi:siroheme synthase (precorrin-2 oxidase/ferrochelatase)
MMATCIQIVGPKINGKQAVVIGGTSVSDVARVRDLTSMEYNKIVVLTLSPKTDMFYMLPELRWYFETATPAQIDEMFLHLVECEFEE